MQTTTVPRFTTADGYTLYFLDTVWRDSLAAGLSDLLFSGDAAGPISDTDERLDGIRDTVAIVCRIDWIAGPRTGETLIVPMTPAERMISVGSQQFTGWMLARGIAPDWVTECLEYAINTGPDLSGFRVLVDPADECGDTGVTPNIGYRVDARPA